MKRVLLLSLDYAPRTGGVARYVSELVQRLPPGQVCVLTTPHKDSAAFDESVGYRIIRRRLLWQTSLLWPRWLPMLYHTWQVARHEGIDVILAGEVLPGGTVAWLVSRLLRLKYIVFTHGLDVMGPQLARPGQLHRQRRRLVVGRVLRRAAAVIANSQFTKSAVEKFAVPAERIEVILPCTNLVAVADSITTDRIKRRYSLGQRPIILSVGRLVERKGHAHLLECLVDVRAAVPNVLLVIIGHGPQRATLEATVKQLQLEDSVLLAGAVPDDELLEWYQACTVFTLASRELREQGDVEGFGIVFLEAAAFGKPAIGGGDGGVTEAVVNGKTGFVLDPEDRRAWREALIKILTNPTVGSAMGQAGQQRVRDDFSWDRQAGKLQAVIANKS